jgi:protein-disulfide isomerase
VEWADFECPACRAAGPALEDLLAAYPEHVRLVFKNFPLSTHQHAEMAARAAVAAHAQGKFWPVHDALFEAGAPLDRTKIERAARDAGVDMKKFVADMESEAVADRVNLDRKQGNQVDIQGTPSLFINGRLFSVTTEFEQDLREWVGLEIQLKTGKTVQPKPTSNERPTNAGNAAQAESEKGGTAAEAAKGD